MSRENVNISFSQDNEEEQGKLRWSAEHVIVLEGATIDLMNFLRCGPNGGANVI